MVAIQIKGSFGRLTVINVYIDGNHDRTLHALQCFLITQESTIANKPDDYILIGGNFNKHHPLWENNKNTKLLSPSAIKKAEILIDLLTEHDFEMALPPDIPHSHAIN
jgi:hypothetical protein